MTGDPRCGTTAGWNAHRYRDESPCDACVTARREYDQLPEQKQRRRSTAKAQQLAYRRLAHAYPDLYRTYYWQARKAVAYAEDGDES